MDITVQYVIVPRRLLYWVVAVYPSGSRRALKSFRDEAAALEYLRILQSSREKIERRWDEREASSFLYNTRWISPSDE